MAAENGRNTGTHGRRGGDSAYNEEASIADTIRACRGRPDLGRSSSWTTARRTGPARSRSLGVTVLRPPSNGGSKAGALNFRAHARVERYHARDRWRHGARAGRDRAPAAGVRRSGRWARVRRVIPRTCGRCERGRYIEYLFAFAAAQADPGLPRPAAHRVGMLQQPTARPCCASTGAGTRPDGGGGHGPDLDDVRVGVFTRCGTFRKR